MIAPTDDSVSAILLCVQWHGVTSKIIDKSVGLFLFQVIKEYGIQLVPRLGIVSGIVF